jgi:hypothetical protein
LPILQFEEFFAGGQLFMPTGKLKLLKVRKGQVYEKRVAIF